MQHSLHDGTDERLVQQERNRGKSEAHVYKVSQCSNRLQVAFNLAVCLLGTLITYTRLWQMRDDRANTGCLNATLVTKFDAISKGQKGHRTFF
jgi:hypothetical protein